MAEKLEAIIPISVPSTPQRPTPRKHSRRTFLAGALVGVALWSFGSLPNGIRYALTPNTRAPVAFDDLQDWITNEAEFGNHKIFDQLGPTAGAGEGLVIAAPSKRHPNYFYTWTRDSAIVTGSIMNRLLTGENELEEAMRLYAYSQAGLQKTCNPSGCPATGGLGEPKFNVDGTAYTDDWGRPQRDGPALRAVTLTRFANYLLDRGNPTDHTFVSQYLYNQDTSSGNSVIKNDLEFTSHECFQSSFDLWEEVPDLHFFTILNCHKALNVGSALATRLGDQGAAAWYTQQSAALRSLLLDQGKFRFPDGSYRAYAGSPNNRRGVDSAVLLGILTVDDTGDPDFGPAAPAVLASVKVHVDAFRGLYAIANSTGQREGSDPIPIGRYPEDKWDGFITDKDTMGNPWYICTVAVPHLIDLALVEFISAGKITITEVSLAFFKQFVDVKAGDVLSSNSSEFKAAIDAMRKWSNGFYAILRQFQGPGGTLFEQFGRETGIAQGAPNLTWSFGAFANAARARQSLSAFMN